MFQEGLGRKMKNMNEHEKVKNNGKMEKEKKKKKKNEKMEKRKNEKCTARDDTSSSSATALRDGGTPHSYPQLWGLR